MDTTGSTFAASIGGKVDPAGVLQAAGSAPSVGVGLVAHQPGGSDEVTVTPEFMGSIGSQATGSQTDVKTPIYQPPSPKSPVDGPLGPEGMK